jgi:hypothetical protein
MTLDPAGELVLDNRSDLSLYRTRADVVLNEIARPAFAKSIYAIAVPDPKVQAVRGNRQIIRLRGTGWGNQLG